jgi:hypothetical protein
MEVLMKTDTATRSDLDALTALNRDYIHSVQHGDVQRFEEILAEDFLCSNPDGSLVDKKQFLALAPQRVRVNAIAPSATMTDRVRGRLEAGNSRRAAPARRNCDRRRNTES